MARQKTHFVAGHLNSRQFHALKHLERLRRPHLKSCTSAVIRDCIEYAYGLLVSKYSNIPTTEPRPLPPIPEGVNNANQ